MLEQASDCKYNGANDSFAASQSMLDNLILPCVPLHSPALCQTANVPCCNAGVSELYATVVSVVQSKPEVQFVVHITDIHGPDPNTLLSLTEACGSYISCVFVCMGATEAREETSAVTVRIHSNGESVDMMEADAIRLILETSKCCDSMMWYWTPESLGYSVIFNQELRTTWVVVLPPGVTKSAPVYGVDVEGKGGVTSQVMPFFYTSLEHPTSAVMGKGFVPGVHRDDLAVELATLSKLPLSRVYSSKSSAGRCFCCQYLVNLHSRMHAKSSDTEHERIVLQLTPEFQQRTSHGSKRHGQKRTQKRMRRRTKGPDQEVSGRPGSL